MFHNITGEKYIRSTVCKNMNKPVRLESLCDGGKRKSALDTSVAEGERTKLHLTIFLPQATLSCLK